MRIALPRVHAAAYATLYATLYAVLFALQLHATSAAAHAMPLPVQAIPDSIYSRPTAPSPAASTPSRAERTPPLTAAATPNRVMPVDPVLLRSGQEVPGDQRFTMEYDGTIYVFSTQRTLDTFRADPATYAAQQGGACGRMGPLGGLGDARRYAIQDNMLYFFASEECRRTFRENPKLYMEPRDIFPSGTPEQQTLGLAAIDRWVAWAGGKDAVKAATSFKHVSKKRVEQGAAEWDLTETLEIEGPRSMQRVDVWQKVDGKPDEVRRYEVHTTPDSATIQGDMGYPYPLADSRRVSFERTLNRQPYAILRARFRPEAGFLALKTGEGKLGDADCDYVKTWFEGNATYVAIDKATGRLVQQGFIGRDEQARNTSFTLDAVSYAGIDALRLPTQWVISRTGETEGFTSPVATITVGWKAPEPPAAAQTPERPRRPGLPLPPAQRPVPPSVPEPASKP